MERCFFTSYTASRCEGQSSHTNVTLYQIGDLLVDRRRMNVLLNRARAKLVIFGSRKTLNTSPIYQDFFRLMENRGRLFALPGNADSLHFDTRVYNPRKRSVQDMESGGLSTSVSREEVEQVPREGKRRQ